MAPVVLSVASLKEAFHLTVEAGALTLGAGAGAGEVKVKHQALTLGAGAGEGEVKVKHQVRVHKLRVCHAAAARELFRNKSTWYVTNLRRLRKLERADAILLVFELELLPALLNRPGPDLLHSFARCQKKLKDCVGGVGGSFVAVGNKLTKRMTKVHNLCGGNDNTATQIREAVENLANHVAAVRATDVLMIDDDH